jgi:hypothetical protein
VSACDECALEIMRGPKYGSLKCLLAAHFLLPSANGVNHRPICIESQKLKLPLPADYYMEKCVGIEEQMAFGFIICKESSERETKVALTRSIISSALCIK